MKKILGYLGLVLFAAMILFPLWYFYIRPHEEPYTPEIVTHTAQVAKEATEVALQVEAVAEESRPIVEAATVKVAKAKKTRIDAGITVADLPMPVADEFGAMLELITAQAVQIDLEIERGDRWKDAALAHQAAADAARNQLQATAKAERRKGFKWGALTGAGAVAIIAVLL
jgi:hypothetical protein